MEGVGEGSSGRCCPNAEEPSKMHSRDATYRIQEGRKDGVSERSKYSEDKAGERQLILPEDRQTEDVRMSERLSRKRVEGR